MKRFALVILLLLAGAVLLFGADITDISWKFKNFTVDVATHTSTQIVADNGNRKDVIVYNNGSYIVYLTSGSYIVAVSTTNGFPLKTATSLSFEDYVGPIYGVAVSTVGSVNVRGIETE